MGKHKHIDAVKKLFEKSPVVSTSSISRITKSKGYTKQMIRLLVSGGKIKKLSKGCYTSRDEAALIVFCFKPAYLGLQDALSFHNVWEQETIPVVITLKKTRVGLRKSLGINAFVRRIKDKYVFGFDYYKCGEIYLPYSDAEKTLIDMVYFRQRMEKDTLKNLLKIIDAGKLKKYLVKYPPSFRKKILALL